VDVEVEWLGGVFLAGGGVGLMSMSALYSPAVFRAAAADFLLAFSAAVALCHHPLCH